TRDNTVHSTPDDHFSAGPHRRVIGSSSDLNWGDTSRRPAIRVGIIFATGVQLACVTVAAPDDHFSACPHCSMPDSGLGSVSGAGGCPAIGAGIVSPARRIISPAPDDHFSSR